MSDTIIEELCKLQGAIDDLGTQQKQLVPERDDLLARALMHGYTQADLARATGLTTARINQLVKRRVGHIPTL